MKPFDELLVWRDPLARNGPECMAVDELILRGLGGTPVLRFYDWEGDWVSVGYFGVIEMAYEAFGDSVSVVQRWTGGGIVDHRHDVTYSLMIPRGHQVAKMRGAESYQVIHQAIAEALECNATLVPSDSSGSSDQCFERPVAWDVVDTKGRKLAGAGQRRTRWGLLHQGSVQQVDQLEMFHEQLERCLSGVVNEWKPSHQLDEEARVLAREKYFL